MAYYGLCFKNSARTKKYEKNYLSPFLIPQKNAKSLFFKKKKYTLHFHEIEIQQK